MCLSFLYHGHHHRLSQCSINCKCLAICILCEGHAPPTLLYHAGTKASLTGLQTGNKRNTHAQYLILSRYKHCRNKEGPLVKKGHSKGPLLLITQLTKN